MEYESAKKVPTVWEIKDEFFLAQSEKQYFFPFHSLGD